MSHVEPIRNEVKEEFRLFGQVVLARLNRILENSQPNTEKESNFRFRTFDDKGQPEDKKRIRAYEENQPEGVIHFGVFISSDDINHIDRHHKTDPVNKTRQYILDAKSCLAKHLYSNASHWNLVHIQGESRASKAEAGFGVNIRINQQSANSIEAAAIELLALFPIKAFRVQLQEDASMQLPFIAVHKAIQRRIELVRTNRMTAKDYALEEINLEQLNILEKLAAEKAGLSARR